MPITTEIISLPQLTAEGVQLALVRMASAAAELEARGKAVSSRALAEIAHISLNSACAWLRQHQSGATGTVAPLSALQ